ncbi:MAG: hypothetical protein GX310_00130 [Synergistaceae bacterium]|nr:hypothetical protein [Synergistaceae bacterium]
MAKRRPSLKDFLATGDVVVDEAVTEEKEKEGTPAAAKKTAPAKKKAAGEAKKAAVGDGKKPAARAKKTAARAKKPSAEKAGLTADEAALLEMLAPEDKPMWEKLFAAAETEFLPLDLVERREDFRTMARDRYTLFRLGEAGEPLFHVRTSVQIREPLVCLIKWDETGKISVFR